MTILVHGATASDAHPWLAFACWIAAALIVAAAHVEESSLTVTGTAAVAMTSIVLFAYVYMRRCAPDADVSHALGVGVAWLLLAVITEIAGAALLRHGCYVLLGSPARPLLRTIFFFVWIFSPAVFARNDSTC
ncbi:MAG TPA: hypothetical protein VFN10_13580 [Thermoanaerobaculia bacterium]|nr:hypothetical protein [Thermoanaerobaculia bacterium]